MKILQSHGRVYTAALSASLALFLSIAQPVRAQLPGNNSFVTLTNSLSLNSSSVIDSFDSQNPLKSTNGLYDPDKRQANAVVSTLNSFGSDLHNAFIYGNLQFSGAVTPKNTTNVQGTVSTPFNTTITSPTDPTWAAGTYVQYVGGNNPPASGMFIASGPLPYPTLIKVVGDFTVPGGKTFSIKTDFGFDRYITIWVTGKLTTSGSGRINQDPKAHVTWIVDKDISTGGDTYKNLGGNAFNLSLNAVGAGKLNLTGNTSFIGTLNAPGRTVSINGAGGLSGAMIGNTLTLGGGSAIHCDEALFPSIFYY